MQRRKCRVPSVSRGFAVCTLWALTASPGVSPTVSTRHEGTGVVTQPVAGRVEMQKPSDLPSTPLLFVLQVPPPKEYRKLDYYLHCEDTWMTRTLRLP